MKKKYSFFRFINDKRIKNIKKETEENGFPDKINLGFAKGEASFLNFWNSENDLVFLLSELIDNSIMSFIRIYSLDNPSLDEWRKICNLKPEIRVSLRENDGDGMSQISILDNGLGFADSKYHMISIISKTSEPNKDREDIEYAEHNAGAKQAIFGIGSEATIIWKRFSDDKVRKYKYSKGVQQETKNPEFNFPNYKHGTYIKLNNIHQRIIPKLGNDDYLQTLMQNIANKYKKWMSSDGNFKKIKIKIFIDDNDISEYFDNYKYVKKIFDGNITETLYYPKDSYKLSDLISKTSSNNEKWEVINNFLNYKINDKYIFKQEHSDKIKNDIKEHFSLKEYSKPFHENFCNFFSANKNSNNKFTIDDLFLKIKKLIIPENRITDDENIFWIDYIPLINNKTSLTNINKNRSLCDNKDHQNDYEHNIILFTWLNHYEKKHIKSNHNFQRNVANNAGFTIEKADKLVLFGNNQPPYSQKFLVKALKSSYSKRDAYNFPLRISGNAIFPECFKTDSNKKQFVNFPLIDEMFGEFGDRDKLFYEYFVKSGKIFVTFLLMYFKNYEAKKNKKNVELNDEGTQKSLNDENTPLSKINIKIKDFEFRDLKDKNWFSSIPEMKNKISNNNSLTKKFTIINKINNDEYNVSINIDKNTNIFISLEEEGEKDGIKWLSFKTSQNNFFKLFDVNKKDIKNSYLKYDALVLLLKQLILLYIYKKDIDHKDSMVFLSTLNRLYTYD